MLPPNGYWINNREGRKPGTEGIALGIIPPSDDELTQKICDPAGKKGKGPGEPDPRLGPKRPESQSWPWVLQ